MSDWHDRAACRGTDLALWFPTHRATNADYDHARSICERCPVRGPCLTTALAEPAETDLGIWAGTTRLDRITVRDADGITWNT